MNRKMCFIIVSQNSILHPFLGPDSKFSQKRPKSLQPTAYEYERNYRVIGVNCEEYQKVKKISMTSALFWSIVIILYSNAVQFTKHIDGKKVWISTIMMWINNQIEKNFSSENLVNRLSWVLNERGRNCFLSLGNVLRKNMLWKIAEKSAN
jgi:hypothetical protein